MSRGGRISSSMGHKSQIPSKKELCIDTRSAKSRERRQNELYQANRVQSCPSRSLPVDRVWFHSSNTFAGKGPILNHRCAMVPLQGRKRDCRIVSPFKQWPQPEVERKNQAPEPAAKIREEVITNINKYQDLVIHEDDTNSEHFAFKSRMSRQGRLQPLLGRPRLSGPSIRQCLGIQPKFRSLGTVPHAMHSVTETKAFIRPSTTSLHKPRSLIGPKVEDSRDTSTNEAVETVDELRIGSSVCNPLGPSNDTTSGISSNLASPDVIFDERTDKCNYRIVHFATYDPSADDDEEDTVQNQKMTVQIKKRISSPLPLKPEISKQEVGPTKTKSVLRNVAF